MRHDGSGRGDTLFAANRDLHWRVLHTGAKMGASSFPTSSVYAAKDIGFGSTVDSLSKYCSQIVQMTSASERGGRCLRAQADSLILR